jgi:hypothetical protein
MCVTKQLISLLEWTVTCHNTYCMLEHGTHHKKLAVCVASVGPYLCNGVHLRLNHAFFWLSLRIFISQTCLQVSRFCRPLKHNSIHRLTQNRLYSVPVALLRTTQPPIQWVPLFFPLLKWLECETDHSVPHSAELRMSVYLYVSSWCE